MAIESINAVTLKTADMARAFRFYSDLGFRLKYGGPDASFTSFHVGSGHLNLALEPGYQRPAQQWGRIIFYVDDVDAVYELATSLGLQPSTQPQDASWGERYFHLDDPDGHELSFARLLEAPPGKKSADAASPSDELAKRAAELYKQAKPRIDELIKRTRPRAEAAGKQALRFAREHEEEIKQAGAAAARYRMRGPLRVAVDAFVAQGAAGGRKRQVLVCAACGTENVPAAKFCAECGQALGGSGEPDGNGQPPT